MVGGLSGGLGGGNLGQVLSKLNIEVGNLVNDLGNMQAPLGALQRAFQDACQPSRGLAGQLGPIASDFATAIIRLAYIAVLKEAMDKAAQTKLFNAETAINDLWIHLEALKRLGQTPAGVSSGGAAASQELTKLSGMIEKRRQLFQTLAELTRSYNDSARAAINGIAR